MENQSSLPCLGNMVIWCSDFHAMRNFYSDLLGIPEMHSGTGNRTWCLYGNRDFSFSIIKVDFTPQKMY